MNLFCDSELPDLGMSLEDAPIIMHSIVHLAVFVLFVIAKYWKQLFKQRRHRLFTE